MDLGPVLDQRDAVANKMTALFSRGEVRDFIDIDTVIESGTFTRDEVLALADTREALPLDRGILLRQFEWLRQVAPEDFALYDVDEVARAAIIERFTQWGAEIDPTRTSDRRAILATPVDSRSSATPSATRDDAEAIQTHLGAAPFRQQ